MAMEVLRLAVLVAQLDANPTRTNADADAGSHRPGEVGGASGTRRCGHVVESDGWTGAGLLRLGADARRRAERQQRRQRADPSADRTSMPAGAEHCVDREQRPFVTSNRTTGTRLTARYGRRKPVAYMKLTVKHHDHAYVERRGGWELYTHLRGSAPRKDYRLRAIQRAADEHARAVAAERTESELGGLGLIVLQRSLLAVEDLAGLLHAFDGPDPWQRLRNTGINHLDRAITLAAMDPERAITETFRLADEATLCDEPGWEEQQIQAALRLRQFTLAKWARQLEGAARLWAQYRAVAKATMHGFAVVAGCDLVDPPGAGELSRGISTDTPRPFAVGVMSTVSQLEVRTERQLVPLNAREVARMKAQGRSAARLTHDLCRWQAQSIENVHKAGIPLDHLHLLSDDDQALLRLRVEEQQ